MPYNFNLVRQSLGGPPGSPQINPEQRTASRDFMNHINHLPPKDLFNLALFTVGRFSNYSLGNKYHAILQKQISLGYVDQNRVPTFPGEVRSKICERLDLLVPNETPFTDKLNELNLGERQTTSNYNQSVSDFAQFMTTKQQEIEQALRTEQQRPVSPIVDITDIQSPEMLTNQTINNILKLLPQGQEFEFYVTPPRFVEGPDIKHSLKREGSFLYIDNVIYTNTSDILFTYFLRPRNGLTRNETIMELPGVKDLVINYWDKMYELGQGSGYRNITPNQGDFRIRYLSNEDIQRRNRAWDIEYNSNPNPSFKPEIHKDYRLCLLKPDLLRQYPDLMSVLEIGTPSTCPVKVKVLGENKWVYVDYSIVEANSVTPIGRKRLDNSTVRNLDDSDIQHILGGQNRETLENNPNIQNLKFIHQQLKQELSIDTDTLPTLSREKYNGTEQVRATFPTPEQAKSFGEKLYNGKKGGHIVNTNTVYFNREISNKLIQGQLYFNTDTGDLFQVGLGKTGAIWASINTNGTKIEYSISTETKECRFQIKKQGQLEKLKIEELNQINMPRITNYVKLT